MTKFMADENSQFEPKGCDILSKSCRGFPESVISVP